MLGGLVLGLLESFGPHFYGGQWRAVFPLGFLFLSLTSHPTGIPGERISEGI